MYLQLEDKLKKKNQEIDKLKQYQKKNIFINHNMSSNIKSQEYFQTIKDNKVLWNIAKTSMIETLKTIEMQQKEIQFQIEKYFYSKTKIISKIFFQNSL